MTELQLIMADLSNEDLGILLERISKPNFLSDYRQQQSTVACLHL
jgi:hypothetical protein